MENNDLKSNEKYKLITLAISTPILISLIILTYVVLREGRAEKQMHNDLKIRALDKGCVLIGD